MEDRVRQNVNEKGVPTAYACDLLTTSNVYPDVVVPYYYDLLYPCRVPEQLPMAYVSSELLKAAATSFRILPTAAGCINPPKTEDPLWVASVSSDPSDELVKEFGCQKLQATRPGECCVVVKGKMTYKPIGGYDEFQMKKFVADRLDGIDFTANTNYTTAYIGSVFEVTPEGGRTHLPPAINKIEPPLQPKDDGNRFTVVGAFVLGGLIAAFIGVFALLIQRRRRFLKSVDADAAVVSKSDLEQMQQGSEDTEGPSLEVDVLSDEVLHERGIVDSFDAAEESPPYTFDLANSFKNEVMAAYGASRCGVPAPTTIAVVPPYPMEETSDSEADSWAQTDGTVGSLEERLEEITAEI